MAENGQGEKSEQPTAKRMDDARMRGQIPRSVDLQTLAVLAMATGALALNGGALFDNFNMLMVEIFAHLHEYEISLTSSQAYFGTFMMFIFRQVVPIAVPVLIVGVIVAASQTRMQLSPKAFEPNISRMNPVKGMKKIFSLRPMIPALLGIVKLIVIIGLTYSAFISVMNDPLFYNPSDVGRLGEFLGRSTLTILTRICVAMVFIGVADYFFQQWQTNKDMMMTKQEVKDESKNTEGNPQVKAKQRQKRMISFRQMLADVPTADAVITNPTHLSVAIRYDRDSMDAPIIVAKGARNNALKIREVAKKHKIPIIEDKPVARLLFRYGRVGMAIPSQMYTAVAEILAYVYRTNAYKYYRQNQNKKQNQTRGRNQESGMAGSGLDET